METDRGQRPVVTVAVPTKDRPDSLRRCLSSVRAQTYSPIEILVIDDGSAPPVADLDAQVRLIRNHTSHGASAVRNQAFQAARGEWLLFLDDDAEAVDRTLVERAVGLSKRVPSLGALAFRQITAGGEPHFMQPARVAELCYASQFFSYGCMIRTSVAAHIGGFEEVFGYYYEEVEFSLRLLDSGLNVVYDPSLAVTHYEDPRGRDAKKIQRLTLRNWTYAALLRYPLWALVPAVVMRWLRHARSAHANGGIDWAGMRQTLREVTHALGYIWRNRAPVRFSTLVRSRRLRRNPESIKLGLEASA